MSVIKASLILIMYSLAAGVFAQDAGPPKIGLALSGGGARGLAHIGVLKELERRQIRIDYIAGTSMGSIVGGLYAAGYDPADIEGIIRDMSLADLLLDDSPRKRSSMRQKTLDSDFLVEARLGFNDGSVQLPLGVVQGQRLHNVFARNVLPVMLIEDFDDLRVPFRAVATDLETSRAVVLGEGALEHAMRASMAIPGVFVPAEIGGQLLVDGGLANNLPVDVVRSMGADIVIAVDVSMPLYKRDMLNSVLRVTEQITSMMTRQNTEAQIASLGENDLLIVPELQGVGSVSFELTDLAIEAGVIATHNALSGWQASPENGSASVQEFRRADGNQPPIIDFVDLVNHSHLADEILLSRLQIDLHKPLNLPELERAIDILYGLERFENVHWSLVQNEVGEYGLAITAVEQQWGPNYLQFGLSFNDDFAGNNDFSLGAAYTMTGLNSLGGELRSEIVAGPQAKFVFDFFQPIDHQARYFFNPTAFFRRREVSTFIGDDRTSRIRASGMGISLGIGRDFGTSAQLRADYVRMEGDTELITGDPTLPDTDFAIGELLLTSYYDSLDNIDFPTRGTLASMTSRIARSNMGSTSNYEQLEGLLINAHTWGRHTFLGLLQAGYTRDDAAPVERLFQTGGFLRLSGLATNQLSGQHYAVGVMTYYRRMGNIDIFPAYVGGSVEMGNTWQRRSDISLDSTLMAGSLFVGARTPLGPIYLGYGKSEGGNGSFYLFLGNPFTIGLLDF